jgi:dTDP-4-amino-4,6-dideoxygalactose transaminase
MPVKFLDLQSQYQAIKEEVDGAIAAVIRDTAFISGKYAAVFEREFAEYQQARHCVGCGNGTDAIEIALEAFNMPPGSEVIVPANSFIASSEAVTRAGHKVVFCDCGEDYTISPDSLASKITPKTKAVIVVHLYGQPCEMDKILKLAADHALYVVEDCAQAHAAEFQGKRVGALGTVGAFSFYPGKNLGAFGDAGAMVTNDEALATRMRMIANHGRIAKYDHEFEGRNSRLDGIQGAILSAKLKHLDGWIAARREIASAYRAALSGVGDLVLPQERPSTRHAYHLFVVRTARRDVLQAFLKGRGIETGVHYPIALPCLAAYRQYGQADEDFMANRIGGELLSLPIGDHMTMEDVEEVARGCREFFLQV